jgi:hypothetical protein
VYWNAKTHSAVVVKIVKTTLMVQKSRDRYTVQYSTIVEQQIGGDVNPF